MTREPRPNGARSLISLSVGSFAVNAMTSVGKTAGRSSYGVPAETSSAGVPLMVSTRTSDAKRSERRGRRTGPAMRSPLTRSQRRTCAAET